MASSDETARTSDRQSQRVCRTGTVVARSGDKTIRVRFEYRVKHPMYGKYVKRFTTLHAHDARNEAKQGDLVELAACRRLSKTKSWRLSRILKSV